MALGTNGSLGSHNRELREESSFKTSYGFSPGWPPSGGKTCLEDQICAIRRQVPGYTSRRMLWLMDMVGEDPLLLKVVSSDVEMSLRRTRPKRRRNSRCGKAKISSDEVKVSVFPQGSGNPRGQNQQIQHIQLLGT